MSRQDTAGTHRAATQSTPGTWFQGKRLPLYGIVGATFLFAGYSFYFKAQHPATSSGVQEKNAQMPGKDKEKQAENYSENAPSRKVVQAAGKKEGEKGAGIFPNRQVGKKLSDENDA